MYLSLASPYYHVSLDEGWCVYWPDESEVIALPAPVKLKVGARVSTEQTHAKMAHHMLQLFVLTWNNLILHISGYKVKGRVRM